MPRWTLDDYKAYEARRKTSRTLLEPPVCHGPLAAPEGEARNPGRFLVSITSFRTRLLDPDNLAGKYFLDCCRYAKLIPGDRQEDIEYSIRQIKVPKGQERTEIEITEL